MRKRILKKFAYGAAAAGMALTLTACGNNDTSSDSGGSDKEVAIDIFQFKVEFKDQFETIVNQYMDENPNVTINITTVGGGDDYGAALKAKFASGNEPNIFNIGGPEDAETWREYLADLSDTAAAQAALDGTLTGVTKDGEVLGLPYNMEGYGLLYNKEIFDKAGINSSDIKTQEDLRNAVELLDSKKDDLGINAVFAFPAKETWVTGLHAANVFLAPEFDNDVIKAYEATEVEFKFSSQFQEYVDLQQEFSVQPTTSLDYSQQMEELFSLGKVALTQQGNWVYSTIYEMDPDFAENNVGILPIPVDGAVEGKIPVGVPNFWAVNSNADEAEIQASKDFLDWLYTSDEGKTAVLEELQFIPAYEGFDTEKIADPISRQVYEFSKDGNATGWVFMGFPTDWGMNVLGAGIQKYVSGEISWDDMIQDAAQQWADSRQ